MIDGTSVSTSVHVGEAAEFEVKQRQDNESNWYFVVRITDPETRASVDLFVYPGKYEQFNRALLAQSGLPRYTLQNVRKGTGWSKGVRFIAIEPTCAYPGDSEHDHAMCEDANAEHAQQI